jgi:hypothetical protein
MNGEPLIENQQPKHSDTFRAMAERIDRNPTEFGGACVIVPPGGGDPIEFLLVDPKSDVAQFFGTLQSKIAVVLEEMRSSASRQQTWR